MRIVSFVLAVGCGCGSALQTPEAQPSEATATTAEPSSNDDERIARLIDPSGFSRIRARVRMGDRFFFIVERDRIAAGHAAIDAMPNSEAAINAYETLVSGCTLAPVAEVLGCMLEVAPDLALVLDDAASWSVAAIEGTG